MDGFHEKISIEHIIRPVLDKIIWIWLNLDLKIPQT